MPNIKLKGQTGEVLTYEDVERVYFDSADRDGEVVYYTHGKVLDGVFIEPNFAEGDQQISVPDGSLVKEATIIKPAELVPENIRSGVTVAGVTGDLIGDTEEVTVDLDMAEGGQVITPSAETKVLSKVTVNKPETMVADNIRAGVDIGGVVGECEVIDYVEADFLPELTFTSAPDVQFGYCYSPPGQFELIVGQTYWVTWDEYAEPFRCEAMDGSGLMPGAVFIGNAEPFNLSGNGEPFAIGVVNGGLLIACLEDNDSGEPGEHTVRVYQIIRSGLEEVTVDLDMADGDQKITQSKDGKVLFKATVTKPKTLIPENIAKDVAIGGVVGTFEGGGGLKLSEPDWIDDVCFWDYDGTLLLHLPLADAKALTSLPIPPSHDGLVFQEWNYTLEEIQAAEYPYDVGATYTTSDGKTHLTLNVSSASALAVSLHFMQTVSGGVTIDWGDGSTTTSGTTVDAATSLTHTYSAVGTYVIKITVKSGCTMTLGGGTSSTYFVGGNNPTCRNYVRAVHVGNNVELGSYSIQAYNNLGVLTVPRGNQTNIPDYVLSSLSIISAVILPRNITTFGTQVIYNCGKDSTNRVATRVSIPPTVTTVGNNFCSYCLYTERMVLPPSLTILTSCCADLHYARRLFISDDVTTIGNQFGQNCYKVSKFSVPSKLTSIGSFFLNYNQLLDELIIPDTTLSVGDYFMRYTGLRRLIVKGTISSANGTNCLGYNGGCAPTEVFFLQETPTSALSNFTNGLNGRCDIYVLDSSVDAYKSAVSSANKYTIRPLSEYNGKLPE